jgi:hypothetical protein
MALQTSPPLLEVQSFATVRLHMPAHLFPRIGSPLSDERYFHIAIIEDSSESGEPE